MEYNIYCDESCHLPNDNSEIMVIGAVSCPKDKSREISDKIRQIKKKHNIFEFAEIKWTMVSKSKEGMFVDLINLFFDHSYLNFRAVVATNKKNLSLEKFNLDHDGWYHRIYYLLLREMICVNSKYSIYVDIKDTRGSEKVDNLKIVLNRTLYDFYDETVKKIQIVESDQIQLMQLADFLIGAVSYANRGLNGSETKLILIDKIQEKSGRSLTYTTPRADDKLNIFKWIPRED